jgi:hypothetical protein
MGLFGVTQRGAVGSIRFLPEPALPVRRLVRRSFSEDGSLDVGGSEDAKIPRCARNDRGEGVKMTKRAVEMTHSLDSTFCQAVKSIKQRNFA